MHCSILYAGYQYDAETGLYYLNARMYDPVIARFLQEDTYRGDVKEPLTSVGAAVALLLDFPDGLVDYWFEYKKVPSHTLKVLKGE